MGPNFGPLHQGGKALFFASPLMSILHYRRHRTDLYCVSIIGRVFKKSVVRIEEFTRKQKKEFPRWPTIVQPARNEDSISYLLLGAVWLKINRSLNFIIIYIQYESFLQVQLFQLEVYNVVPVI
jgi:hypothetical protein